MQICHSYAPHIANNGVRLEVIQGFLTHEKVKQLEFMRILAENCEMTYIVNIFK